MSRFICDKYKELKAYVPGEQPTDMEYIKLNTNESPYPPSTEVIAAVNEKEAEMLNLYPDPTCKELKSVLAQKYGVLPENVFVSNGSDDILNFAFMAFAKKEARFPEISYGFYEVFCRLHSINFEKIPLREDFSINADNYCTDNFVVIANPNAPTGMFLEVDRIEHIVRSNPDNVVVIDEAYIDFGGTSCISLTKKYDNILVVQTFSKSRSLAGARVGFAIGNKELICDLEKIKYSTNPYSINRMSLKASVAAVQSDAYYADKCSDIIKTREYVTDELKGLGFTLTDSVANFVFAKKHGLDGKDYYERLKANGVLVRHFEDEKISDYNRITIGTFEQMKQFIKITEKICKGEL